MPLSKGALYVPCNSVLKMSSIGKGNIGHSEVFLVWNVLFYGTGRCHFSARCVCFQLEFASPGIQNSGVKRTVWIPASATDYRLLQLDWVALIATHSSAIGPSCGFQGYLV